MFEIFSLFRVGVVEILIADIALLVGAAAFLLWRFRWALGFAACWIVASLATPADPLSTIFGVLLCVAGALTFVICQPRPDSPREAANA